MRLPRKQKKKIKKMGWYEHGAYKAALRYSKWLKKETTRMLKEIISDEKLFRG